MRACLQCGLLEDRRTDTKGREVVNLDPVSGLCITCLVHTHLKETPLKGSHETPREAKARRLREVANTFDPKLAQAGKDDE